MPDIVSNELLRNVSAAAIALEGQRELLRSTMQKASEAGLSLRQISAASPLSHEGVRRMINDQNRETMKLLTERVQEALKPIAETMQSNLGKLVNDTVAQAFRMNADISRQLTELNAKVAKQTGGAANA
jgi:Glu-tRNA(Gln) amidotransferase subunit E-like FAD-binding protein